jgi:membrane-associated protein
LQELIDFILHIDARLTELVAEYGAWVYGLLFAIVFAETGLVIAPFLPGDSLLFAAGGLAATGALDIRVVVVLLIVAAIAGDAVNYSVGRYLGPRMFHADDSAGVLHRLLNRHHLDRAHEFFERHGGKAVVLARFVPIVRTFVPFVAGAGAMRYSVFAFYNVAGALLWVAVCVGAGYVFGNVPIVKNNFTVVALGIVAVSLIPVLLEYLKYRKKGQRN